MLEKIRWQIISIISVASPCSFSCHCHLLCLRSLLCAISAPTTPTAGLSVWTAAFSICVYCNGRKNPLCSSRQNVDWCGWLHRHSSIPSAHPHQQQPPFGPTVGAPACLLHRDIKHIPKSRPNYGQMRGSSLCLRTKPEVTQLVFKESSHSSG